MQLWTYNQCAILLVETICNTWTTQRCHYFWFDLMGNSDVSRCRSSSQDPQHDVNESSLFCRWFIPELVIRGSSSRASLKTSRWRDVRSHDLWVEEESSGIQQAVFKGTGRTCVRILKMFLKYLNWTLWATNEKRRWRQGEMTCWEKLDVYCSPTRRSAGQKGARSEGHWWS